MHRVQKLDLPPLAKFLPRNLEAKAKKLELPLEPQIEESGLMTNGHLKRNEYVNKGLFT